MRFSDYFPHTCRILSALVFLCISGTIISFSPSHRGKIAKCSRNGYSDRLQFSRQTCSPSASRVVMSAGARDIRSKDIGLVGVAEKIRRVLRWFATLIRHLIRLFIPVAGPEKTARYVKGNTADSASIKFVQNLKFDATGNDLNDGDAEYDSPNDNAPVMESVTPASKIESGNKANGSEKKPSISAEIPKLDPRNYKNSQRQEADKSYAERKLMEIETKQIETANNKIKLQNKAEAASKWVLNSLSNTEKSPHKKYYNALDKNETDDDNSEVESDDSDRNSKIDTDLEDNVVVHGSSSKTKNLLYDEAQLRKLSSSSAVDFKTIESAEESRFTDKVTNERKIATTTTNAVSTTMDEIENIDTEKKTVWKGIVDKKVIINEIRNERSQTRVEPIEAKKAIIKSSITNIDNGALTQTLTAVINEKSSNSFSVKPNLNVILKKSLKDSLYPINPDGTYTTKETIRPIKETSLINDFVRNSIIISEKVELERRQNRIDETRKEDTKEAATESNELKEDNSMKETTNDDDQANATQQKVEEKNSTMEGSGDILSQAMSKEINDEDDAGPGENESPVNNSKGMTSKEQEHEEENIENIKLLEFADDEIILAVEIYSLDQSDDEEKLPTNSDKEKYSLPPVGGITLPNTITSNSAVTFSASMEPTSFSSTTSSPSLTTSSASAISDSILPTVAATSQSLNSYLEKENEGELEVEEEIESYSRVSTATTPYLSPSLPASADIRMQLISTAVDELGIRGDDIESNEEVEMNKVRDEDTLEASDVERIEDEAEIDSASSTAEYNPFPYYTPPPPPYTNAPRCLLGSWQLSETRYIDDARSVVSDSSVEVINIPSFGTVSSSLSGSKGLEWKANKSRPVSNYDGSNDEDSNVSGERGEEEGEGEGGEGFALKGVFDEYSVEFNIVRGCSSTEWMKGQGRNERVITARIIKPPKEAFEQRPTLCTYEGVLTSEEYIQGMVFSTPVTVEGERRLVGEFQMNKL